MAERTFILRIEMENGQAVLKGLDDLGDHGDRAGKRIKNAMDNEAAKGMTALTAAVERAEASMLGAFGRMTGGLKTFFASYIAISAVRGFGNLIGDALDAAASIKDVANGANVTTQYLQEMRFAAAQNGASAADLDDALTKLNVRLGDIRTTGAGPAAKSLDELGLTSRVLSGEFKNTGDAADAIFDALAKIHSDSDRTAIAVDLFGKAAGPKLAEFLKVGSAGIADARQEAERLGLVLSNDLINNADDASDKLNSLFQTIETIGVKAIAENADAILELAQAFASAMPGIIQSLKEYAQYWGIISRSPVEIAQRNVDSLKDKIASDRRAYTPANGGPMREDLQQEIWKEEAELRQAEAALMKAQNDYAEHKKLMEAELSTPPAGMGAASFDPEAKGAEKLAASLEKAAEAFAKVSEARRNWRDNPIAFADAKASLEKASDTVTARDVEGKVTSPLEKDFSAALKESSELRESMRGVFHDSFIQALKTGDVGQFFEDMAGAFSDRLYDRLADGTFDALFDAIFSNAGGGGGGGIGGFLGQLLGGVARSLGGGLGGGTGAALGTIGKGFDDGGFTGRGDRKQPAGIVHKGEFVFDAETTEKLGVPFLMALKKGGAQALHQMVTGAANPGGELPANDFQPTPFDLGAA